MGSLKTEARTAGWLYFVFALWAVINNFFVSPGFFVPGDAAATARNIQTREFVFRLGILLSFVELLLFVVVVVSLYALFERVDKKLSMLMVSFVTLGIAVSLSNMVLKAAPLYYLGGADYLTAFSRPQLEAFSQVFLNLRGTGNQFAMSFWGLWLFPLGALAIRSGFVPPFVGYLVLIAGVSYVVTGMGSLVLPDARAVISRFAMPFHFGELAIVFWLMIWGARETRAKERSAAV